MVAILLCQISQADPAVRLPRDGALGQTVSLQNSRILVADLLKLVAPQESRIQLSAGLKDSDRMVAIFGSANVADLLEAAAVATTLEWVKTDEGFRLSVSSTASKQLEDVRKADQLVDEAAKSWTSRLLGKASLSMDQITARKAQISQQLVDRSRSDAVLSALEFELQTLSQLEDPAIQALVALARRQNQSKLFGIDLMELGAKGDVKQRVLSMAHADAGGLSAIRIGHDPAGELKFNFYWLPVPVNYARLAATENEIPSAMLQSKKLKIEAAPEIITPGDVAQRLSLFVTAPVIAWDSRIQVPYAAEFAASWNDRPKFIELTRSALNVWVTKSSIILRPWEPVKTLRESPPERALRSLESIATPSIEDAALFTKQCSPASIRAQSLGTIKSSIDLQGIADASPVLALWLQLDSPQRAMLIDRHALSIESTSPTAQRLAWSALYDSIANIHGRANSAMLLLLPPTGPPNPLQIYVMKEAKVTYSYRVGNAIVEATADQITEEIRKKATERSKLTFTMMIGRSPIEAAVYEFSLPVARPKPTKSPSGSEHE